LEYENVKNYDGSWTKWSYFNDLSFKSDSIENFLKPTIPEASQRGYFASFILALEPKTEILYFAPPGIAKRQFRPPQRGDKFGNPEVEPSGNYLD
tara:strand:+ start:1413 stop:1697 length:285 start_codon:yes stop_codon:yes gene_type:complete